MSATCPNGLLHFILIGRPFPNVGEGVQNSDEQDENPGFADLTLIHPGRGP